MIFGLVLLILGVVTLVMGIVGSIKGKELYWTLVPVLGIALILASTPSIGTHFMNKEVNELVYNGEAYTKISNISDYKDITSGENIWISNEFLENLVAKDVPSEDGTLRVSGASIAKPYGDGYLLKGNGQSAVYVDVKKDDEIRSIPIIYEKGKLVFYQGDHGEVRLNS